MSSIKLFESRKVRTIWSEEDGKWYFSVIDVVGILTDSVNPRDYWYRMKERELLSEVDLSTICRQFKMEALDGKLRETDCADTKGILRIIQSIPSPKAEPFKQWLAKVGEERIEEIENPEIASKRMREIYKAKGYSDDWIEKRIRGIAIRDELTEEWKKRGIKEEKEYSILTAEISKETFGMTPREYKEYKNLENLKDNLRDHMTDLELIFTMLGEASTTEIARNADAKGFQENKKAARSGGKVAGNARKDLEKRSGKKVSVKDNYKQLTQKEKKSVPAKNQKKKR